jgi:cell filamentation protein
LIPTSAHYFAEINSAHPFREGNGRTQRAFVSQLAAAAGYRIEWARLEAQRNVDASRAAHRGDNQPLRAIFDELISEL